MPSRTKDLAHCFPPIADPGARVLILGSMPGAASLRAAEYYAHPRNAFWPIMGELFGAGPKLPYHERCAALRDAGVAVWDVLAECCRPGSLDASIQADTERPNDVAGLLAECPRIERIAFNGQKAESVFRRRVLPTLPAVPNLSTVPEMTRLLSTSPANASLPFEAKLTAWRTGMRLR